MTGFHPSAPRLRTRGSTGCVSIASIVLNTDAAPDGLGARPRRGKRSVVPRGRPLRRATPLSPEPADADGAACGTERDPQRGFRGRQCAAHDPAHMGAQRTPPTAGGTPVDCAFSWAPGSASPCAARRVVSPWPRGAPWPATSNMIA